MFKEGDNELIPVKHCNCSFMTELCMLSCLKVSQMSMNVTLARTFSKKVFVSKSLHLFGDRTPKSKSPILTFPSRVLFLLVFVLRF